MCEGSARLTGSDDVQSDAVQSEAAQTDAVQADKGSGVVPMVDYSRQRKYSGRIPRATAVSMFLLAVYALCYPLSLSKDDASDELAPEPPFTIAETATPALLSSSLPIAFLHIHKCAGTTMCEVAKASGVETNVQNNCNPPKEGFPQLLGSPGEQQAFFESTDFAYVPNELTMPNEPYHPQGMLWFTALRHPLSRTYSHYYHSCQVFNASATHSDACSSFESWLDATADNFMVRSLCGVDCYGVAKGGLGELHLQKAMQQLEAMDTIVLVEQWDISMELLEIVSAGRMSYQQLPQSAYNVRNSSGDDTCEKFTSMTAQGQMLLLSMHSLDLQLYAYGESLFQLQSVALLHELHSDQEQVHQCFPEEAWSALGHTPLSVLCGEDTPCEHAWGHAAEPGPIGHWMVKMSCFVMGVYCEAAGDMASTVGWGQEGYQPAVQGAWWHPSRA